MSLNPDFAYQPLEKDAQIRVIVLAPGRDDEPIHCFHILVDLDADWESQKETPQLEPSPRHAVQTPLEFKGSDGRAISKLLTPIFHLDSEEGTRVHPFQRYMALSYVWGDQSSPRMIFFNGLPFYVGKNLYNALGRLRRSAAVAKPNPPASQAPEGHKTVENSMHHLESEGRLIWIDAMCINQADMVERAAQVRLMPRIYMQADHVFAELSFAGNEAGDKLLALLESILAAERAVARAKSTSATSGPDPLTQLSQRLESHGIPPEDDEAWTRWRLLMKSPYFQRLWVIQEFSLARRITLSVGDTGIDPWLIFACITALEKHSTVPGYYLLERPAATVSEVPSTANIRQFLELTVQRQMVQGRASHGVDRSCLLQKLILSRNALASDPRDKVYGMLGLASDASDFLDLITYSSPVESVYESFARRFVELGQCMDMLYLVDSRTSETLQIPSWVPDWSRRSYEMLLYQKHKRMGMYAASKDKLPTAEVAKGESKLRVEGAIFDTIRELSEPLYHMSLRVNTKDFFDFLLDGVYLSGMASTSEAPTDSEAVERLLWTLFCDRSESRPPEVADRLLQSLLELIHYLVALVNGHEFKLEAASVERHRRVFMGEGGPLAAGRCWCLTENNHFGLVPAGTRVGDHAAIFYGGDIPFLVRPQNTAQKEEFTLVGNGFFHGLMHGEAFELASFRSQQITIV